MDLNDETLLNIHNVNINQEKLREVIDALDMLTSKIELEVSLK